MGLKLVDRQNLDINWNEFESIDIPEEFTGECRIYVDKLDGNIEEDVRKLNELRRIQGLKEVTISSKDFKVAEYFETM